MYEVELKVRADHDAVRERLRDLEAEFVTTVEQADTYYDHPVRDFAETDEALRVRRVRHENDGAGGSDQPEAYLTYKGPLVDADSKTREEHETFIGNAATAAAILESLGFTPAATVEKRRERYRHGDYTVALDDVVGLGEFVEVETETGAEEAVEATETGVETKIDETKTDTKTQTDDEIETDDGDIDRAREGCQNLLRRLGLDPDAQIRTSYLGMCLAGYSNAVE